MKAAFTGTPNFTIKWFKEEKEILTGGSCFIKKDASSSTLALHSVKPLQSGKYTCQVSNDAGTVSCTAVLFVKGASFYIICFFIFSFCYRFTTLVYRYSFIALMHYYHERHVLLSSLFFPSLLEPPKFARRLDSSKLSVINSVVVLECEVTGSPEIAIKWYKNNIEISPSKTYQITFTDSVARLQIINCTLEESGDYICVASSDSGSDKCSCLVTVKGMK